MKDGKIPQMSPMMWLIFPVIVMVLNVMVMEVNSMEKVDIELFGLDESSVDKMKW